ncbi:MAG: T9SS type A sorting domain-containing protein [Candidatus Kapabacteria bacterium]|nr:T9SS type A sorting domain-containing protein [Candidatus Kapabacteria bacterium]
MVNTGLTYKSILSLAVSGTTLFAGTDGGGVFRAALSGSTSVKEQSEPSLNFTPFPNPFSDQTTLEYDLPTSQHVRIAIFSPLGQLLFTLADEWQQAGRHSLPLDMNGFASGAYIARLQAGTTTQTSLLRLVR